MVSLTVVIPCYKAADRVLPLWKRLVPPLLAWSESSAAGELELLFVDDGSPDETARSLVRLRDETVLPPSWQVRIIRLQENAGQQAAVYCGLEEARGEWIITMDDDLQHPPEFIPRLLLQSKDVDLVYALPADRRSQTGCGISGVIRGIGSRMRDVFFHRALGVPRNLSLSSYRLIRRKAVLAIRGKGGAFVYPSALLFRENPALRCINQYYPVSDIPEDAGPSRIPPLSRVILYVRLFREYGLPAISRRIRRRKKPRPGVAVPSYKIRDEL